MVYKRPKLLAINPEDILATGLQVENDQARALFFLAYLSGGRINEMIPLYVSRFKVFLDRVRIEEMPTEKHKDKTETRTITVPLGSNSRCKESEMWEQVFSYIKKFDQFSTPFKRWKNMSEYLARLITIKAEAKIYDLEKQTIRHTIITKRFNPHFMRHCRATHLALYYHFNETELCKFFGWKDPKMAVEYVQANIIEEKLCHGVQQVGPEITF